MLLDGRPWFAGPATTVVIAIGQFLRGLDVVPRGHPGRRPGRGPGVRARRGASGGPMRARLGDRRARAAPPDPSSARPHVSIASRRAAPRAARSTGVAATAGIPDGRRSRSFPAAYRPCCV